MQRVVLLTAAVMLCCVTSALAQSAMPAAENALIVAVRSAYQSNTQSPYDITFMSGARFTVAKQDVHDAATAIVRGALMQQAAPPVEPARLFVLHVRQQVPAGKYVDVTLMSGATIRVTAADVTDFRLSFLRTELVQAIAASKAGALSGSAASPQGVPSQQEAQAGIRAKCASDWPDDFRMRAYCQEQQDAGYAALSRRAMGGSADQQTIRAKCAKDWPDDFRMRNYCEEKQLNALRIIR